MWKFRLVKISRKETCRIFECLLRPNLTNPQPWLNPNSEDFKEKGAVGAVKDAVADAGSSQVIGQVWDP